MCFVSRVLLRVPKGTRDKASGGAMMTVTLQRVVMRLECWPWAPVPFTGCAEDLVMCSVGSTNLRCGGGQQGAVNELGALRLDTFRPCDHPGTRHLSLLFKAQDHNFCLLKL